MDRVLELQAQRFRAMSADEKISISQALWLESRDVMSAGVRARHPDWTEQAVAHRVRELMRDAGP
jgi:hypothetical protein